MLNRIYRKSKCLSFWLWLTALFRELLSYQLSSKMAQWYWCDSMTATLQQADICLSVSHGAAGWLADWVGVPVRRGFMTLTTDRSPLVGLEQPSVHRGCWAFLPAFLWLSCNVRLVSWSPQSWRLGWNDSEAPQPEWTYPVMTHSSLSSTILAIIQRICQLWKDRQHVSIRWVDNAPLGRIHKVLWIFVQCYTGCNFSSVLFWKSVSANLHCELAQKAYWSSPCGK